MVVMEFGSYGYDVSYRKLFVSQPRWRYVGVDGCPGPNVDIVVDWDFKWESIPDNSYDLVVTGQTMEHVKAPWKMAQAIYRVTKPGGMVMVIAPWKWDPHPSPIDCWRVLPDGMIYVMSEVAGFEKIECGMFETDTFFFGKKTQ
jgi:SAM-dependent methyltransferase